MRTGIGYQGSYLARWLSADTLAPAPETPQSFNRYSWVLGNPLKFVDPTGHKEEGACSFGDENEIRENQEAVYEAYWAYCSENPADPACEPGDPLEGAFWFVVGVSGGIVVQDLILIGGGLLGEGVTKAIGWFGSLLCADSDCGNEAKTAYEIGQEGQKMVLDFLNDPAAQEEVRIYVGEAGKRANYFARLGILTETVIHEVKNVSQLSLSLRLMNQATAYKMIADGAGLELHCWLVNSAPPHVVEWLEQLGAIVHVGVPGP